MAASTAARFLWILLAGFVLLGCIQPPVSNPQTTPVTATGQATIPEMNAPTPGTNTPEPSAAGNTPAPSVSGPGDDSNWNTPVLERNKTAPILPEATPTPQPDMNLVKKAVSESASAALASGTKIVDWPKDWVSTGRGEDNPSFYPLAPADMKEVDVGVDSNYLYVKALFYGAWPGSDAEWPVIDGDRVTSIAFNVGVDADNNAKTGVLNDGGTEIQMNSGCRFNVTYGDPPGTWNDYKTNPSGIEDPEEKRYLNNYYADTVMLGGPGHDYAVMAYPLKSLGLSAGQKVTLLAWVEANSEQYHHAAFDPLDPNNVATPDLQRIEVTLGENRTIS